MISLTFEQTCDLLQKAIMEGCKWLEEAAQSGTCTCQLRQDLCIRLAQEAEKEYGTENA